jgi:hypothetical protein
MTDEDKKLLLIDLSARLPYGVKCCASEEIPEWFKKQYGATKDLVKVDFTLDVNTFSYVIKNYDGDFKPYLRPLSSMTEEEILEFILISDSVLWLGKKTTCILSIDQMNWLNAHHFDYRGLIEKCLAIEATEDMYEI